jgi:hypothetical protein
VAQGYATQVFKINQRHHGTREISLCATRRPSFISKGCAEEKAGSLRSERQCVAGLMSELKLRPPKAEEKSRSLGCARDDPGGAEEKSRSLTPLAKCASGFGMTAGRKVEVRN